MDKKIGEDMSKAVSSFFRRIVPARGAPKKEVRETSAAHVAKCAAYPALTALFSFAVSASSPALGALPVGPALLCAAPSFISASSIAAGMMFASLKLGAGAIPFIFVALGVFSVRFALGMLGSVKTKSLGDSLDLLFAKSDRLRPLSDDLKFRRLNCTFNSSVPVRVLISAAAAVLLGVSNLLAGTNPWYDIFGMILGGALTPMLCFALSSYTDPAAHPTMKKAGLGALLFCALLAAKDITIGGMKIALIVSVLSSFWAGYSLGVGDGALIAVFAGFALEPGLFALFPLIAMCTGALGAYTPGGAAAVSTTLGLSWALLAEGVSAISSSFPEILLGAALFYPAARFGIIKRDCGTFLGAAEGENVRESPGTVSGRMKNIAHAMEKMSRVFYSLSSSLRRPDAADVAELCESAFSAECSACSKREICHARTSFADGSVIRSCSRSLEERGRLDVSALPPIIVKGCPSTDVIISRINSRFGGILEEGVRRDKVSAIASDYKDISKMIAESVRIADEENERNGALSDKLSEKLSESGITFESLSVYGKTKPRVFIRGFTVRDLTCGSEDLRKIAEEAIGAELTDPEMSIDYDKLNMYAECRKKYCVFHGEYSTNGFSGEENGDSVCSFKGCDGDFFLLICDGMGSGGDASVTAKVSCSFLKRMIGAGCPVPAALEALNNFTRERGLECFSTVDLLKIDPFSGRAVFYKSGAAPSFVLREGRLFKIECASSPLGILKQTAARSVTFSLREGDVVVMLSDGALPEDGAAKIYELLSDRKNLSHDLPDAAKKIVSESRRFTSRPDDATAGVVRIENIA